MQTVSVIGLGKLGAPFLATCALRGFSAIGVDVNSDFLRLVNQGKAPVSEPGLGELFTKYRARIRATGDWKDAIINSEITFVIVPTPSKKNGSFSNKFVLEAAGSIGKILRLKKKFHLVVVVSTVSPQSMEMEIVPRLEKFSGKKAGVDFGVCYNPEFIALGSVITNLLEPDFILIGESDNKSGRKLENFYGKFCKNKPPVFRMNFVNAEIAKIALNSYITTKISFANTLANICERIPGGNVDLITEAIGTDSRVGRKYIKGGLSYGGPCFPRDNRAFLNLARKTSVLAPIAKAVDKVNEDVIERIVFGIKKSVTGKKTKIAILGLAYKPYTNVIEESAGLKIANVLAKEYSNVFVWDPEVIFKNNMIFDKVIFAKSLRDCIKGSSVIVITMPNIDFKKSNLGGFKNGKKPVLVDCWRMLNPLEYAELAHYRAIGIEEHKLF